MKNARLSILFACLCVILVACYPQPSPITIASASPPPTTMPSATATTAVDSAATTTTNAPATATTGATATPRLTFSQDEQVYFSQMMTITMECLGYAQSLSNAMTQHGKFATMDSTQRNEFVTTTLKLLAEQAAKYRSLTPPERFARIHELLLDYASEIDKAVLADKNNDQAAVVLAMQNASKSYKDVSLLLGRMAVGK
jgi:hypothetical protein